ncbi:MAG: phosphohydrolase [Minisyncoccia bacterium]
MITLAKVNNNSQILEFIQKSDEALKAIGYTEHGFKHATLVADRARNISQSIGLTKNEQELSAISGFCHDMANFLSRNQHQYLGSLLFFDVFKDTYSVEELTPIMQAIAIHDNDEFNQKEIEFVNKVSAVLVIADKSDVRRSRVYLDDLKSLDDDIHARVNYATKQSKITVDKKNKVIALTLDIDTKIVPVMEYFEIFTQRMVYCRKAANYLGYQFALIINKFQLL